MRLKKAQEAANIELKMLEERQGAYAESRRVDLQTFENERISHLIEIEALRKQLELQDGMK